MEGSHRLREEDNCLMDVYRHVATTTDCKSYGPMRAYITGFEATIKPPWRFLYQACTFILGNGHVCARSVRGENACDHRSEETGERMWELMFRFDVTLADHCLSAVCPPVRVGIFRAGIALLGLTPYALQAMTDLEQVNYVLDRINRHFWVDVIIRCNNGSGTISGLNLRPEDAAPMNPPYSHVGGRNTNSNKKQRAKLCKIPSRDKGTNRKQTQFGFEKGSIRRKHSTTEVFEGGRKQSTMEEDCVKRKKTPKDVQTGTSSHQSPSVNGRGSILREGSYTAFVDNGFGPPLTYTSSPSACVDGGPAIVKTPLWAQWTPNTSSSVSSTQCTCSADKRDKFAVYDSCRIKLEPGLDKEVVYVELSDGTDTE